MASVFGRKIANSFNNFGRKVGQGLSNIGQFGR